MKNTLLIDASAYQAIVKDLEKAFPNEGCGFFYGKDDGNARQVFTTWAVPNAKEGNRHRRFEISPLDYIKAERKAKEFGSTLLGVYHSHPNHPALPSVYDLRQAMPYFSYIILSVHDAVAARMTSWRLAEGKRLFEEEQVMVRELLIKQSN